MPKLNPSTGESLMGLTSLVSVDGVVPAGWTGTEALGASWVNAVGRVAIAQQNSITPPAFLQTLDLDTSVLTTVSTTGTSAMSAGGDVWAAYTFSGGVRTNVTGMGPFVNAGLCEVSATGQVAIVTNINEGGITVYNNLGTRLYGTSAKVAGNYPQRLRSNLLSWVPTEAIGWQLIDITTSTQISWQRRTEGVFALIPVTLASGAVYVLEMTEEGSNQVIWLRAATKSDAYRVYTGPAHWPDVIELTPGVVRLAWSVTAGEGVTALRVADITLATGGFSLGTTASGALSFSTQPTLTASPVATTPYGGAEGLMALFVAKHPFTDPRGVLTTPFGEPWVRRVSQGLGQPVDLSNNVTGVLQPGSGGTGTTTGLTEILGEWITGGTIPQGPKWRQFDLDLTGSQDNVLYDDADYVHCDNLAALTLTGLSAGVPGQRMVVVATTANTVTFAHEDVSSDAANRLLTTDGADVILALNQAALLEYDGTDDRWRVLFVTGVSGVESAGYWSPLTAGITSNWSEIVPQMGYWSPVMTGPDAATSELVLTAEGDCVVAWTKTTDMYFPPLVDDEGDTIAVWTPTP